MPAPALEKYLKSLGTRLQTAIDHGEPFDATGKVSYPIHRQGEYGGGFANVGVQVTYYPSKRVISVMVAFKGTVHGVANGTAITFLRRRFRYSNVTVRAAEPA